MPTRPIRISVVADADKARKDLSSLGDSMKRGLTVAAAAGAAGIAVLAKSSITAASEAQQSIGATQAIYGKYANTVIKQSKEAADAVGLSANAYRESSNLLGALFKNQGVSLGRLSSTTSEHLKLASDLSAMYGGTVTDAVDALTAAYKGEFNQLEKYGVTLKQDTINTAANQVAKQKYGKELKKLSPAQESVSKQLATQQLLFKQTKDAAGSFGRESNTLAGQQQRLGAEVDNVKAEIGTALLPVMTDLAKFARSEIVPAVQDFSKWLGKNQGEIRSTAREIGSALLPPLEATAKVVGETTKFFANLPGPVKEVGVQVGIAALVLPKLSAGLLLARTSATAAGASMVTFGQRLAQNRAAMSYQTTAFGKAREAMVGFGGAARSVAGVGGMVALMQASKQTSTEMKTLTTAAGGALLGFSLGGPWGAAIGAGAGALVGLSKSADTAKDGVNSLGQTIGTAEHWAEVGKQAYDRIRSSLNELTAAYTKTTTAAVYNSLQEQNAFNGLSNLGLTRRDVVRATLGEADAVARVNAALQLGNITTQRAADAAEALTGGMEAVGGTIVKATTDAKNAAIATADFGNALKGLPTAKRTAIEAEGVLPTTRGIARLANRYDLLPKTVKAIIRETGAETTGAKVAKVRERLIAVQNTKVTLKGWLAGIKTAISEGAHISERDQKIIKKKLEAIEKAHPNLAPYVKSVRTAVANANTTAAGSTKVGNQLKQGLLNGMAGTGPALSAIMSGAVRDAIAAARREADSHSPSRKTAELGRDLGAGLVVGMRASQPRARTAGQKLMSAVLEGVRAGSSGVSSALEKISAQIEKSITGKNEGARERALLKRYAATFRALRQNGLAQDRVTAKLEKARDRLKELTDQYDDYKKAIVDSIKATGDVTQLGRNEDGTVSITSLINELKNKVVAAQRFAALIRQLADDKLNQASIQQMLDAGPEAALATAEAIAAGGASAVTEINALQAELAKTGTQLGGSMADRYYGAGVQAAQGLVKGLEAEQKSLDKIATTMATALVTAVKRALGIKSPSREFRKIGDQVTAGLIVQLKSNGTYVKRSGAVMASQLQKGFGTPALEAFASQNSGRESEPIEIRLSADQLDKISHGAKIQATLDFARSNGVRGVTF